MKPQSNVYEGTYKEDLTSIQSNQRSKVVHERPRCINAVREKKKRNSVAMM